MPGSFITTTARKLRGMWDSSSEITSKIERLYNNLLYNIHSYNKVTRSPQFSIDHLFKMKAMQYSVICGRCKLVNLLKMQIRKKILDFQSLLKDNGVFNQKSIIPKCFPSQLSHPLDLLFDPLYNYVANDNAFINIQKMMVRKWMERD